MQLRHFLGVTVLALSGCSDAPSSRQAEAVSVVTGNVGSPTATASAIRPAPATQAAIPVASATPARQLSVAESAAINTAEMWSEPVQKKD